VYPKARLSNGRAKSGLRHMQTRPYAFGKFSESGVSSHATKLSEGEKEMRPTLWKSLAVALMLFGAVACGGGGEQTDTAGDTALTDTGTGATDTGLTDTAGTGYGATDTSLTGTTGTDTSGTGTTGTDTSGTGTTSTDTSGTSATTTT